jgi:hypothetical protein
MFVTLVDEHFLPHHHACWRPFHDTIEFIFHVSLCMISCCDWQALRHFDSYARVTAFVERVPDDQRAAATLETLDASRYLDAAAVCELCRVSTPDIAIHRASGAFLITIQS